MSPALTDNVRNHCMNRAVKTEGWEHRLCLAGRLPGVGDTQVGIEGMNRSLSEETVSAIQCLIFHKPTVTLQLFITLKPAVGWLSPRLHSLGPSVWDTISLILQGALSLSYAPARLCSGSQGRQPHLSYPPPTIPEAAAGADG